MEIGKQRQVCQGFRLNQGSNPHDLLLDDPWDLTAPSMYLKQSYYYIQIIIMEIFYFVEARLRCGFVSFEIK